MLDVAAAAHLLARRGGVIIIMNSLSQGGGDRVAVHVANGLARAGILTRIALLRDSGQPELRALVDEAVSIASAGPPMGFKVANAAEPLGHRHLERLRGVRHVRREIDAYRPAVVLGASDNMAFLTALVRRPQDKGILFGFKLTNRLSRPNIGPGRRVYRRNLFNFIFDRLDLVLTLSEGERRHVLRVHPGREAMLRTVPNPYVTEEMVAAAPEPHSGPPQLLAAGRMVPQKRFDNLLRAVAQMRRTDARLTILGDGPLRATLESLASSLGIADRVDMPGYSADVVPHLRCTDLFVLSSDYEGLPAVVIEALACGVPVAATESFFAAGDLLSPLPSCAVVPIGDPAALAQAIDRCLAEPRRAEPLRGAAEPYRIQPAIDAHIATLGQALQEFD